MIEKRLIEVIRAQFKLDWQGIHGANHWARVRENGLKLAETTRARIEVVELFAFLHDSQRVSDGVDHDHGARAAAFARRLRAKGVITLSDSDFNLLTVACAEHSDGSTKAEVTVQTCWDADRLDLGRCLIRPEPRYLCTDAAKSPSMIEWAYDRSLQRSSVTGQTLYHGTSSTKLNNILRDGLLPSKSSGLNAWATKSRLPLLPEEVERAKVAVSLTPNETVASVFAFLAGQANGGSGVILQVTVPGEMLFKLKEWTPGEWQIERVPPEWIVAWKRVDPVKVAEISGLAHLARDLGLGRSREEGWNQT